MLQRISSVFVVYRCKTLTGSPDPTHANGTNKPCKEFCPQGQGRAWQGARVAGGGWQGASVVGACEAWGAAWLGGWQGGHVWQMGVHGRGWMCGRGSAWQQEGEGQVWQILADTVNERAVHILLECILL